MTIELMLVYSILAAMIAELIVFCMGADPADKQVNLGGAKKIFAYHTVVISSNVKNNPTATLPQ